MKTLAEMRARMKAAIDELQGLRDKEGRSAEDESQIDALLTEINELGPKIQREMTLDSTIATHQTQTESRGRVSGIVPPVEQGQSGTQTRQGEQHAALGKRVFDSDEMDFLRKRNGEGVASYALDSFWEERSLASTATLPGSYLEPMRIPGIQRVSDPFGSLRDVLNVGQTNSDSLIYFRETAFTNNAAIVGEATATTGTSGLKPESGISFEEKTSNVVTIAHWIPITRQMIWNAPELQTYIEGRLIDGLRLREDQELLSGDGTAGHMTGLLNTSGVQLLDGAAFTASPVAGAGTDNENFNRILRARTVISTVGRAQANFVVLNPVDHEAFMTTTDGNRQYFGAGPFAAGNVPSLWGLRPVINENQPEGEALVGDGRQATIWDRMQAQVLVGTINDQFTRNMLTLLAEERIGLTVFRPQAFARVSLV